MVSTLLFITILILPAELITTQPPGKTLSANTLLPDSPTVELRQDKDSGHLSIFIEDREAFAYQYSNWWDLPHYWPLRSPSGKNMLVQKTQPYPHHRCFWFADTISFEGGRPVSTYNSLYTGQITGTDSFGPPFRDWISHLRFTKLEAEGSRAVLEEDLCWNMDGIKKFLDEKRQVKIHALGRNEYLMDITTILTAAYGTVEFVSDNVHYAWPYLRMNTSFSGDNGGTITSSSGKTGQEATNMQPALWVDYSNTLEGTAEGIAVFQWPDGEDHRWLTREYGCFGPRRPDRQSGKPFVLQKGESISQRVGILIHRGDVKSARVADRYKSYINNRWK